MICIHCGAHINPKDVFYSVMVGVYECSKCHNADINIEEEKEARKPINFAEVVAIAVTIVTLAAIFYLI